MGYLLEKKKFKPELKMKVVWNTCAEGIWSSGACQWELLLKESAKWSASSALSTKYLEALSARVS